MHRMIISFYYPWFHIDFIAQLVRHRTGIAEVTGSNPVEALIFSGFLFLFLDHGGPWVQIPSGARIFSESTFLLEFT